MPQHPPRQSPLLYGRRLPLLRQRRLEIETIGLRVPVPPELLRRQDTVLGVQTYRLVLWQPGRYRIGDYDHYALRVKEGATWTPYPDVPVLEMGDQVIKLQLPRYRLRALMHPTEGPLWLSPGEEDTWNIK